MNMERKRGQAWKKRRGQGSRSEVFQLRGQGGEEESAKEMSRAANEA